MKMMEGVNNILLLSADMAMVCITLYILVIVYTLITWSEHYNSYSCCLSGKMGKGVVIYYQRESGDDT